MKTLLLPAFLLATVLAQSALASEPPRKLPGNVTVYPSSNDRSGSVILRNNGNTVTVKMSAEAARRVQKTVNDGGRVTVYSRRYGYIFPRDHYYYRDRGAAYSAGRAVGNDYD